MARVYTEWEVTMAICYSTMKSWDFSWARRRDWVIYASRHRSCTVCKAEPNQPCMNLHDVRYGNKPRVNKQPHDSRIDWDRLLEGLKMRGYYRPAIEHLTRKRMPTDD